LEQVETHSPLSRLHVAQGGHVFATQVLVAALQVWHLVQVLTQVPFSQR
jgi:hypothetical protein